MKQTTGAKRDGGTPPPIGPTIDGSSRKGKVWGRPFPKGKSGNPGGRRLNSKQGRNLGDIARSAAPDAVQTLINIMKDEKASAAVRAYCADKIIDRAYGKAPQTTSLNVTSSNRSIRDLTDAELMSIIEGNRAESAAPAPPALPAPVTIEAEALPPIVAEADEADAA